MKIGFVMPGAEILQIFSLLSSLIPLFQRTTQPISRKTPKSRIYSKDLIVHFRCQNSEYDMYSSCFLYVGNIQCLSFPTSILYNNITTAIIFSYYEMWSTIILWIIIILVMHKIGMSNEPCDGWHEMILYNTRSHFYVMLVSGWKSDRRSNF